MAEKRIDWKYTALMNIAHAYNKDGEHLGNLLYERVGAHMHWCWYQMEDIRMSPGCLQEVRDKQKELLRQSKKK